MISFNLQDAYYPQEEAVANFDPAPVREAEKWEHILEDMKTALIHKEYSNMRKLMFGLEFEMHESRMKSYNAGYAHGCAPLPF